MNSINSTISQGRAQLTDLQLVRQRFLQLAAAIDLTPATASPAVRAAVAVTDDGVAGLLAGQIWQHGHPCHGSTNGSLEPLTPEQAGLFAYYYLGRPSEMALAWCNPLSRYFHDEHLLSRLEASLRYIEPLIGPQMPRHGSWYLWDIANPEALALVLICAGEALPLDLRAAMERCLLGMPSKVFTVERGRGIVHPIQGGTNMMSILFVLLLRGLALEDEEWLKEAAAQISVAMKAGDDGEGLQEDWSFHFHGCGVNVGYGAEAVFNQSRWTYLTQGTPWACKPEDLQVFLGSIAHFFRHNLWRGRVSPYAIDRSIASPRGIQGGASLLNAFRMGLLANLPPTDQAMLAGAAQEYLTGPEGAPVAHQLNEILLTERTQALISKLAKPYTGTFYFPSSEYLLARRKDWFLAARLSSTRTKTWNSQNGQHVYGSLGAEFSLALMTDGSEFDATTIPTMDWQRIMGTTRCDAIESSPEGYGQSNFVGGLANEQLAVMACDYLLAPPGQSTLRARKSLFVNNDALVLMGSGICCDARVPVFTTLFQAPLQESTAYTINGQPFDTSVDGSLSLAAGDWLLLRNVAIRLLEPAVLHLSTREGCYNDMNAPQVAKEGLFAQRHSHRWLYLLAEHGIEPRGGSYGAVIWPAVATEFVPPDASLKIHHQAYSHRVEVTGLLSGASVQFPGDFRTPGGFSYYGAEPFKWGSLAQWQPAQEAGLYELTVLLPPRHSNHEPSNVEVLLPAEFNAKDVTLVTMEGKPFPANVLSLPADGQPRKLLAMRG